VVGCIKKEFNIALSQKQKNV